MAKELGADLFGIADLTSAQDFVCKQGGEYLRKFSRAISIGIRLLDAVVDELYRHEDPAVIYTYTALYNSANSRLDHVGLLLAKRIQEKCYKAYAIPASQTVDSNKLIGVFSHKLAANFGWSRLDRKKLPSNYIELRSKSKVCNYPHRRTSKSGFSNW
jgi:epoxyqueuosine reductase QueG